MRAGCCLVALAVTALVAAGTAPTATFFLLEPTVAAPGDRVTVRSPCPPARATCTSGAEAPKRVQFDLYFVENEVADSVTSPSDSSLVPLGVIEIDEDGHGSLTFTVPDVGKGTYTIAHRRVGPCSHSGICGPAFHSATVGDQIVSRYRPTMTLRVRSDDSLWPLALRYAWPLVLLVVGSVLIIGAVLRTHRQRATDRGASPAGT
jgi:hypothetical protein